MNRTTKILLGIFGALILVALFFNPGWIYSPFGGEEKAKTGEVTVDACKAELGACTDQLATCDLTDDCKKTLGECKTALTSCEAKLAKKDDGKKIVKKDVKKEKKQVKKNEKVKDEKPVVTGGGIVDPEVDTTPKLHGPADVEFADGKITVKTKEFVKVAFFGTYGVCQQPVRYVEVKDGKVEIPSDLPPECREFNFLTADGKWAIVGAATGIKGACVKKETSGPFAGAHAYSLACK